jgi:hypothetical protein
MTSTDDEMRAIAAGMKRAGLTNRSPGDAMPPRIKNTVRKGANTIAVIANMMRMRSYEDRAAIEKCIDDMVAAGDMVACETDKVYRGAAVMKYGLPKTKLTA